VSAAAWCGKGRPGRGGRAPGAPPRHARAFHPGAGEKMAVPGVSTLRNVSAATALRDTVPLA